MRRIKTGIYAKIAVDEAVNQFDLHVRQIEISHAKERLTELLIHGQKTLPILIHAMLVTIGLFAISTLQRVLLSELIDINV